MGWGGVEQSSAVAGDQFPTRWMSMWLTDQTEEKMKRKAKPTKITQQKIKNQIKSKAKQVKPVCRRQSDHIAPALTISID